MGVVFAGKLCGEPVVRKAQEFRFGGAGAVFAQGCLTRSADERRLGLARQFPRQRVGRQPHNPQRRNPS